MGMATGCGCKEVYRYPHSTYPPLVSVLFCSNIPTFCSFLKMFFILVPVLFVIFYVLKKCLAQYKHTYGDYGRPTAAI